MSKKDLIEFLSNENKLEYRMPAGDWVNYSISTVRVLNSDLTAVEKTIRLQKIFRYIYDNEVRPLMFLKE